MNVLTLNSSPRGDGESKTELMLNRLVAGMREGGAEVEEVSLKNKKINPCAGCFNCWTKSPGICVHKDDMTRELFPQLLKSDLVVYASPLYHFTVNAVMKTFIERTLPLLEPFFVQKGGRTFHPLRHDAPKTVVLSVAGFPEISVFDLLSSWVNFIFGGNEVHTKSLVAEIYRPMAEALTNPYLKDKAADILEATLQAGRQLAASMNVCEETLARIRQPMVDDPDRFMNIGNLMWKTCIAEGITPKELGKKGFIPRPDSSRSFIDQMKIAFNAGAAKTTEAKLQFNFSGDVEEACYLTIDKGTITAETGRVDQPDLTVDTPFDVWMDIVTQKADGQQMFMEQKYTAEGDLELLMQMGQWFGNR